MGLFDRLFGTRESSPSATAPEAVTIVSGLPRSGTSMMMRIMEAAGLPILQDQVRAADGDNPKGYYEFERVKRLRDGDTTWLPEAEGKVVKVISALLEFLPQSHRYRVAFIIRDLDEVMASQRRMLENRGEDVSATDEAEMRALYESHLAQIRNWLTSQPNVDVHFVSHREMLKNPAGVVPGLAAFLGLEGKEDVMVQAVDPTLYRQRVEASTSAP